VCIGDGTWSAACMQRVGPCRSSSAALPSLHHVLHSHLPTSSLSPLLALTPALHPALPWPWAHAMLSEELSTDMVSPLAQTHRPRCGSC